MREVLGGTKEAPHPELVEGRRKLLQISPLMQTHDLAILEEHDASYFSSRWRAAAAARRTLSGAVPPKLVRLATDFSTPSTAKTSAVMRGSTDCSAVSGRASSAHPFCSARRTSAPVT